MNSSLIEFTIRNYRSVRDSITVNMIASGKLKDIPENLFSVKAIDARLLRTAVFYGANASGKTNLFKAVYFAKRFILESVVLSTGGVVIPRSGFKLWTEEQEKSPSFFEFIFLRDDILYKFNFEITEGNTIVSENFYCYPEWRERLLFERSQGVIKIGPHFREWKGIIKLVRPNALFLTVSSQFNLASSVSATNFFKDLNVIFRSDDYTSMTFDLVSQDEKNKQLILDFLRSADISLKDIRFQSVKKSVDELDDGLKEFIRKQSLQPTEIFERKIDMIHSRFDSSGKEIGEIRFDVSDEESEGTRNLLRILSPLFLTMYSGGVILVDELDASMHPLILQMILEYFQNPDTNTKNAQLIFNAHDASLMDAWLLRRDQILFADKDQFWSTSVYSLSDFDVRKSAAIEKNYKTGKFGGVPKVWDISKVKIFPNET